MSYIEFKSLVKKVNLKPDGVKEIVLEVKDNGLKGQLESLSEMIDSRVDVALENMMVNYNVTLNAQTNKPITEYKVDEQGVVHEVESEPEQIEADLGLPPEKVQTKEEDGISERGIIDQFIVSGLAPTYEDLDYDFHKIMKRHLEEGVSYLKIASEHDISSGKLMADLDDYRQRLAPMATKWWEWKEEHKDNEFEGDKDKSSNEKKSKQDDDEAGAA